MSDRKYRQRGYRDEDPREETRGPRSGAPQGPRPKKEGPRGRGLGAPTATVFRCSVCGEKQPPPALEESGAHAFAAACRKCKTDLHTCTHCLHFDTSAPKECRKPIAERIRGKAKANRCELFEPKMAAEFRQDRDHPSDAKSAFDALFDF